MIPVLIAAAGALLFLGGGKKKRSSSKSRPGQQPGGDPPDDDEENGGGVVSVVGKILPIPPGTGKEKFGDPGSYCKPPKGSPKGTYAAVSLDGQSCMVFWKPETRNTVHAYLQQEFDKLSKAEQEELCARDNCEPDQFAMDPELFCEWVPNPDREAFVKRVVMMMYPQIPSEQLPPPEPDHLGRVDAPYFIKAVWSMSTAMFAHDFCGFNPVT